MKKPLIKNIKDKLKIAVAGLLTSATIAIGATGIYANIKYDDYLSDSEIEAIANDLECDTTYLNKYFGKYLRMEHNEDEPIYVCFDDELTEEEKQDAVKALDYMFDIVGTINKKYRYKIVNKDEYISKSGKTRIYYQLGSRSIEAKGKVFKSNAYITGSKSMLSLLTAKRTMNDYKIYIDREEILNSDSKGRQYYIMVHELMHAFGFKDVYLLEPEKTTDKFYGNTHINNSVLNLNMLTPNDIKCLISLYSSEETDEKLVNKKLQESTIEYYERYTTACAEKALKAKNLDLEDMDLQASLRVTEEDGRKYGYNYKIKIEDGNYQFIISDLFSKEILDECSGKAYCRNGIIILENIQLKTGMRPYDKPDSYAGGFVQDFVLGYFENQSENIVLYDVNTNWSLYCKQLERQTTLEQ